MGMGHGKKPQPQHETGQRPEALLSDFEGRKVMIHAGKGKKINHLFDPFQAVALRKKMCDSFSF
jgi:hypothetical protein